MIKSVHGNIEIICAKVPFIHVVFDSDHRGWKYKRHQMEKNLLTNFAVYLNLIMYDLSRGITPIMKNSKLI